MENVAVQNVNIEQNDLKIEKNSAHIAKANTSLL
jgi:hypothetical protein